MSNTENLYNYIASISYNGFNYNGFQLQKRQDSIQQQLENVLFKINQKKLEKLKTEQITASEKEISKHLTRIAFAGRTDSKVHAIENLISFSCYKNFEPIRLIKIFNYYLPDSIRVNRCQQTEEKINPRYAAIERIYLYIIYRGTSLLPFIKNLAFLNNEKIDLVKLKTCLSLFEGRHNFVNFTTSCEKRNPVRTIFKADLLEYKNFVIIIISGNSFLHKQIRFMIGTALMYSQDKIKLENVIQLLNIENSQREKNTITKSIAVVPPEGLYLARVRLKNDDQFNFDNIRKLLDNLFD